MIKTRRVSRFSRPARGYAGALVAIAFAQAAPLAAAGTLTSPMQGADTLGTLEVSGTAAVMIASDRARATFAVETEGATAQEASAENADLMEAVILAVRQSGAVGLSVQTSGYDVRPRYARPSAAKPQEQRIAGYTAVNSVQVTVEDVEAVGGLIDAAISAGANRVASLVFFSSDTQGARLRALTEAVTRARAEAATVADAMNMKLGGALRVRTDSPRQGFQVRASIMEAAQAATTPVAPGQLTVRATVTITFRLENR
ncbi:MAG: SIMPL domain-containing protein [Longimicrobiales bacterium]